MPGCVNPLMHPASGLSRSLGHGMGEDAEEVTTVYVGNLPPEVDEQSLLITFSYFGPIDTVQVGLAPGFQTWLAGWWAVQRQRRACLPTKPALACPCAACQQSCPLSLPHLPLRVCSLGRGCEAVLPSASLP